MSKNKKIVWWVVGIVVVVGIVWWGVARHGGSSDNVIKVGFIGPLTGDTSSIGIPNKAAIQVAIDEINASGGINGKKVVATYEDGQCAAEPAVSAAQKLINVDDVRIIFSECSTETSAMGPMAMQDKVIVLSGVSSAPSLSKLGKYFFRDYPSDAYQGKFDADYAYQTIGARKVAVLYSISDYGTGIKNVFEPEFTSLGGTIVDEEGLSQTATDYRTALSKIKNSGADIIYAPMYPAGASAMVVQAAQLGIKTKFLGADGWDDPSLQKIASGKGTFLFTTPATASLPADLQAKILAISGGTAIPIGTANAYDLMKILAASIAKVGTNPDKLADAIRATQYDGLSGKIAFDQNGDLVSAAYDVKQIKNRAAVIISQ